MKSRSTPQLFPTIFALGIAALGCSDGEGEGGTPSASTVTAHPAQIDALFANPAMGWQTFHHYADNDPSLAGLPSGSAYFRFKWQKLEPTDGSIDVDQVVSVLKKARAAGQTLMLRVMTAGSDETYAPTWLSAAGCKVFQFTRGGASLVAPDLDDPTCWMRFERLMSALGERLGDEPDVQVDIGGVGLWGEWHFAGTEPKVPMPSVETRKKVVDLHLALFPNSPHQALIGDVESLAYATSKGTGWRADCLGDWGLHSPTWNHMENLYKQHVAEALADSAWHNGPVAWETCGTIQEWIDAGFGMRETFQYAIDMHGSFVNAKSAALPSDDRSVGEVESLLRMLGYRLALRAITHPEATNAGASFPIAMSWENLGVAPPYHPFGLAFRLTPPAGSSATSIELSGAADVRVWLPGTHEITESLSMPSSMVTGTWTLSVGIRGTPGIPMLHLAIEGRDVDGWYPVSTVRLQ